jgi:hypothetical protein
MNSLLGIWLFTSVFYHGQLMDPPNPNLKIYYTFQNEYQNEIYYYRTDETGFCRRWANYETTNSTMIQTIDRVDENNNSSCSSDPDMQLGKTSAVHFEIINEKLHLYLPLGDEEIQYIFDKQN